MTNDDLREKARELGRRPNKLDALNEAFLTLYKQCPEGVVNDLRVRFQEYLATLLAGERQAAKNGIVADLDQLPRSFTSEGREAIPFFDVLAILDKWLGGQKPSSKSVDPGLDLEDYQ